VNGKITAPADAYVSAADEGFLRGDGAFEVLQVYAGHPFALESHLRRFAESCAGIVLDFPRAEILADLAALLDEAGAVDALWRVLITRGGTRLHFLEWVPPEKRRSVPVTLHSVHSAAVDDVVVGEQVVVASRTARASSSSRRTACGIFACPATESAISSPARRNR